MSEQIYPDLFSANYANSFTKDNLKYLNADERDNIILYITLAVKEGYFSFEIDEISVKMQIELLEKGYTVKFTESSLGKYYKISWDEVD
jgi:hypothetical protein